MGLKAVFETAVETAFSVFNEAVKSGQYTVVTDDGFSAETEVQHPVRVIFDSFSEEDVQSSFYPLIQPTDIKALIPGKDVTVPMNTANTLEVEGDSYSIVGFDLDPYKVLYTLLLRGV